jgi:hypothetical protein
MSALNVHDYQSEEKRWREALLGHHAQLALVSESDEIHVASASLRKIPRGLHARSVIQCVEPDTGEIGCWLFTGDSHREPGSRVSPVFSDCLELFTWCRRNNWRRYGLAGYLYEPCA